SQARPQGPQTPGLVGVDERATIFVHDRARGVPQQRLREIEPLQERVLVLLGREGGHQGRELRQRRGTGRGALQGGQERVPQLAACVHVSRQRAPRRAPC